MSKEPIDSRESLGENSPPPVKRVTALVVLFIVAVFIAGILMIGGFFSTIVDPEKSAPPGGEDARAKP